MIIYLFSVNVYKPKAENIWIDVPLAREDNLYIYF